MDIYSNTISPEPVMYLIKEVDETANNKKIFYQEIEKLLYALETETEIAIDSITVVGIKTLLNIISIVL